MAEQGINIKGRADLQQILTALIMQNQQLLQTNLNIERINKSLMRNSVRQKQAGSSTKKHSSALKGLALKFVGYNLILNQVMGAQQKLVEFVKESVTKFREFETRLAEVSTILGEDVDQMSRFKAGIESLALTYGQATSDISKGLYDILSAAFTSSEAMNLLNTSIKASIAGLSDVRTSVKIFTTVLNSYGKSVEQATHVSDILFQSVIRGKFQFEDLEQALGYVVPIAAQAGLAFDELMGALSTATRHGLHLDMTARGLALAIQGIINPSEGAKNAARAYSVEMNGLALRVLGLKGWFDQLGKAMDKHGKSILGELIPNMRSVRVAMVLAGEEGALGFAEDLRYLENVAGATETALTKMMNTSTVVAKKIAQEMEQVSREIGADWDALMLGLQQGVVNLAKDWEVLIPIVGGVFMGMKWAAKESTAAWQDATAAQYRYIDGQNNLTYNLKNYLDLKREEELLSTKIAGKMGRGEDYQEEYRQLQYLISLEPNLERVWNTFIGGIKDAQDALGQLEINLDETVLEIDRLGKVLSDPVMYGTYGQIINGTINLQMAQLEATKLQKDGQHDIKMALVDANYEWVTNDKALQAAVKTIREHTEVTKKDKLATDQMSTALRRLHIQTLEIQLSGMMRRRGLTRSEEKQLKRIQIKQAKLRLENMKGQYEETKATVANYSEAQDVIDEYLRINEEATYQLRYNYNQQRKDLDTLIGSETTALKTREKWWEITNFDILSGSQDLYNQLLLIASDPTLKTAWEKEFEIDVESVIESALARIKAAVEGKGTYITPVASIKDAYNEKLQASEAFQTVKANIPVPILDIMRERKLPGFYKRGIESIPYDMVAEVHRDERIVPAGRDAGDGGIIIENVTINVKEIADIGSVEKVGAVLGAVRQANISDKYGRSKYRL